MPIDYQPLESQSLAKQIADNIREAILEGRLRADDRLPTEMELAERFGVSRPTIREALKRLAAQNLVRSRRGPAGGTFVNRPGRDELSGALATAATLMVSLGDFELPQIAEARESLEMLCCRLAAERRTAAELEVMAEELERQRAGALTDEEFCASDVRFHRALVTAAHNPVLEFVMYAVIEALQPVMNLVVYRFRDRAEVLSQHGRILSALREGNGEAACTALSAQMASLRDQFARAQAWREEREAARSRET